MPVIVAGEVQDAMAGHVQRHVVIVCQLVQEMAGVRAFVAATSVLRAPHVSARTNALIGPAFPLPVGVESDGNRWRFVGAGDPQAKLKANTQQQADLASVGTGSVRDYNQKLAQIAKHAPQRKPGCKWMASD